MEIDFEKLLLLSDEFYEKDDNFSNKFRQAYSDIWEILKNEYNNKDNLPIELIHIISIYSHWGEGGSAHQDLNRLISHSFDDDYILTFEKYLNYSLEKLPPYNSNKLLRRPNYYDGLNNSQYKGYIWEVKKFLSCTYDMVWSGDLLYEIYTKKDNSKARLIEPYTFQKHKEKEVLFMSNTVFEIIDIKTVEFEQQRIVLQEL
jgi:hypothetical protein